MKILFQPPHKLHFIGIAGCGMAPLAAYAQQAGFTVQGSDTSQSIYTQQLQNSNISIYSGHSAKNVSAVDLVIYSSSIDDKNVEIVAARKNNIPCFHRSEFLAQLLSEKKAVTVAGTHGKTTTAAMITHMLEFCGQSPQALIGGIFNKNNQGYMLGTSDLFIAEADESDGSFLNYRPYLNIITNIDEDHLDHFGCIENIEKTFSKYLDLTREEGIAVVGWDNKIIRKIVKNHDRPVLSYGTQIGADVRLLSYEPENGTMKFDAMLMRQRFTGNLSCIGAHNLQNMLAALTVAIHLKLDLAKAVGSFSSFQGVKRRLSLIYGSSNIKIYDDYAHNPGKTSAVLSGLKESFPEARIHALFEPHRYSRFNALYSGFTQSFYSADFVGVLPVYGSGENHTSECKSHLDFACSLNKVRPGTAQAYDSYENFVDSCKSRSDRETIFITLGAGSIHNLADQLKLHFENMV